MDNLKPKKINIIKKSPGYNQDSFQAEAQQRVQQMGKNIIHQLISNIQKKGISVQEFADLCGCTVKQLIQQVRKPHKLDMRTISKWESVLKMDILVSRTKKKGYFGRLQSLERIKALPLILPAYRLAAKSNHIISVPFVKAKHLR